MEKDLAALLDEAVNLQKEKLFHLARRLVPYITYEDILQPCDFPELENHPIFRYEEGVFEGLLTAKTLFMRFEKDKGSF
jgi:hypothetical protein